MLSQRAVATSGFGLTSFPTPHTAPSAHLLPPVFGHRPNNMHAAGQSVRNAALFLWDA